MSTLVWVNLGPGNGLLSDDTQLLQEPVLTYHQSCTKAFISEHIRKAVLMELMHNMCLKIIYIFSNHSHISPEPMICFYYDWALYQQQRIFQTNKDSINWYYLDRHIWFWVIELQAVIFVLLKKQDSSWC